MNDACALLGTPNGERVRFSVESDESALRIHAVLGSLGFDVIRDYSDHRGDLSVVVARVTAHHYHLTEREHLLLREVLRGQPNDRIGETLGLTLPTVKWNLHNLYFKLDVHSREGLLRRVFRLDDPCWLREPRLQRDALEHLHRVALEAVAKLRALPAQDCSEPLQQLDDALIHASRLAGLAPPLSTE